LTDVVGGESYCPWRDLRARSDLTFAVARLPLGDGWYLPDVPGIVLDERLGRIARRCVLAHELAHLDLGHLQVAGQGAGTSRLARRNEAEADLLAARRLLPMGALEHWLPYAASGGEAAELLDVTARVLEVRLARLDQAERARLRRAVIAARDAA
jgi:Zn-dependent peptidase ImmA (M78 family)